jgi:hypothetical protein
MNPGLTGMLLMKWYRFTLHYAFYVVNRRARRLNSDTFSGLSGAHR